MLATHHYTVYQNVVLLLRCARRLINWLITSVRPSPAIASRTADDEMNDNRLNHGVLAPESWDADGPIIDINTTGQYL